MKPLLLRVSAPNTSHAQLLGNLSRELNALLVSPAPSSTVARETALSSNDCTGHGTADTAFTAETASVGITLKATLTRVVSEADDVKARLLINEELEDERFRAHLLACMRDDSDMTGIERSLAFSRCDDLRTSGSEWNKLCTGATDCPQNLEVRVVSPESSGGVGANIVLLDPEDTELVGGTSHSPLRLHGLKLVNRFGLSVPLDPFIFSDNDLPMPDSGASLVCLGRDNYEALVKAGDGAVETCVPGARAVTSVRGVGGTSQVVCHVRLHLDFGGRRIVVHDVPVLPSFRGFLIGNDLLNPCRASINYLPVQEGDCSYDGSVQLFNSETLVANSEPLYFTCAPTHTINTLEPLQGLAFDCIQDETPTPEDLVAARRAALLSEATPIAFAPEPIVIPAWGQKTVYCRAPAAAIGDAPLCLAPLEDHRRESLGVIVVPEFVVPDRNGHVPITLINHSSRKRSLPLLAPLARYIINPEIGGTDLRFTVEEIIERVHIEPSFTKIDVEQLTEILTHRRRLFSDVLGWAHGYKLRIETPRIDSGEVLPPNKPNRRRSAEEEEALRVTCEKLLKQNIVAPVKSPYNAIPMPIKKADGTYRVVIDWRALNQLTTRDAYPLPTVDQNLALIGDANIFTTIDLLMGFHQQELHEDSVLKTAFSTSTHGQLAFLRVPMGLTSSPGAFMRLVDSSIRHLPPGRAVAYLDDVCVPTKLPDVTDKRLHFQHIAEVFDALIASGFTAKCDKVHIGMKEVGYLGFLVGAYGNRPSPSKVQAILDLCWESMRTDQALAARFAGMIGFYHRFIPHLHSLLAPFYDLKPNSVNCAPLSLRLNATFVYLNKCLVEITSLTRPDPAKPFYVDVDSATTGGPGAVLSQREDETDPNSHRPIAIYSRRFNERERGYPVRDQECTGLVDALKEWRSYILGNIIKVRTDHRSLSWLMSSTHRDGSRVSGLALDAQGFDPEITYVPGKQMIVPDFWSRACSSKNFSDPGGKVTDGDNTSSVTVDATTVTGQATALVFSLAPCAATEPFVRSNRAVDASSKHSTSIHLKEAAQSIAEPHFSIAQAVIANGYTKRIAAIILTQQESTVSVLCVCEHSSTDNSLRTILPHVDANSVSTFRSQLQACTNLLFEGPFGTVIRDAVGRAIKVKPSTKGSVASAITCFVATIPYVPIADNSTHAGWLPLSTDSAFSFILAEEQAILLSIAVELSYRRSQGHWRPSSRYGRVLKEFDVCTSTSASVFQASTVNEASVDIKRIIAATSVAVSAAVSGLPEPADFEAPPPLFIDSPSNFDCVTTLLHALCEHCISTMEAPSVAIDLEGALGGPRPVIDLLQLSIDAPAGWPLTCVFDTFTTRYLLEQSGPISLRAVLEDSRITKVFHCMHGDVNSLFQAYGVTVCNVFDTGIADSVLRLRASPRGLESVLADYVKCELTYKGDFVHSPGLFQARPLPPDHFVYAYEDVLYCNHLYLQLRKALQLRGFLEYVMTRSQQICPPYSLDAALPTSKPPTRVTVVLCDGSHAVCLRELSTKVLSFPWKSLDMDSFGRPTLPHDKGALRKTAIALWRVLMGPPPKPANMAINSRLQKAVRVGDFYVLIGICDECSRVIARLTDTASSTPLLQTHSITAVPWQNLPANIGVTLLPVVQYCLFALDCQKPTPRSTPAYSNILLGPVRTGFNGALLLHSATHVLMLQLSLTRRTQVSPVHACTFASLPIAVDHDHWESAVDAFDSLHGSSLRKQTSVASPFRLMPTVSDRLADAFKSAFDIGTFGNTHYYSVLLPELLDFQSSFVAARSAVAGFRQTNTDIAWYGNASQAPMHGLRFCTFSIASHLLTCQDQEALASSLIHFTPTSIPAVLSSDIPVTFTDFLQRIPAEVAHASPEVDNDSCAIVNTLLTGELPDVGTDKDFDNLFLGAVTVLYASATAARPTAAATAATLEAGFDSIGTPLPAELASLSRADVLSEQHAHPATSNIIAALSGIQDFVTDETTSGLLKDLPQFFLSRHDELLLRRSPQRGDPDLIVLPPRFHSLVCHLFHARHGHFGRDRVKQLVCSRFYWSSSTGMRVDVDQHIALCGPCAHSKIPHHGAGSGQVIKDGEFPFDVLVGDEYEVGLIDEEGYDRTISFADTFS